MSLKKKAAQCSPSDQKSVFGYVREYTNKLCELPQCLIYFILLFYSIVSLSIGAPCTHYVLDEDKKSVKRLSACDDTHNHTIYTDHLIDSTSNYIIKWTFTIDSLNVSDNITFGLVPQNFVLNESFNEDSTVYCVSKYNDLEWFDTYNLASLNTNDTISFTYNTIDRKFQFFINKGPAHIISTNVTTGPKYQFAILLHNNNTKITINKPNYLIPDPAQATFDNCCKINFGTCFCCNKQVHCDTLTDVISHLYSDYTLMNKRWNVCDVINCNKYNKQYNRDTLFVYHLFSHCDVRIYECMVYTNNTKCTHKCKQLSNFLTHLNNIHLKGLTSVNPPSPTLIPINQNPKEHDATFENCHSEYEQCPICNFEAHSFSEMTNHTKISNCFTANTCPKCKKKQSSPYNLVTHMSKCYGMKMFKCEVIENGIKCNTFCVEARGMKKHLKKHYSNKSF